MAKENKEPALRRLIQKLRVKYRLVIMNDQTFEEKVSFRLSRMNVFIVIGFSAILLIVLTSYIIAYTGLREYIPGYTDRKMKRLTVENAYLLDSLEELTRLNQQWMLNIGNVIDGNIPGENDYSAPDSTRNFDTLTLTRSREDSMLRIEMEQLEEFNLAVYNESTNHPSSISNLFFVAPVRGRITNGFNPSEGHFGIDIVGKDDETVKATLDGVVIFSSWTLEMGYVISIQHPNNLMSVYKHNNALLKKQGDKVSAGEAIAVFGGTGELSTGPHLHFELWHNGRPVNPREYMNF